MLIFEKLSADYFYFVRSLYETAFPVYERRSWKQLLSMLALENMQVIVATNNDEAIGFAIYWQIDGWYFLEHLAIDPTQEGKGLGSEMMQWLLQKSDNKLLLETELSTNEISARRIRFYEKLGLQTAPFFYQQPPYRLGETTPAMYIMAVPQIADKLIFTNITTTIRKQVFEAFY